MTRQSLGLAAALLLAGGPQAAVAAGRDGGFEEDVEKDSGQVRKWLAELRDLGLDIDRRQLLRQAAVRSGLKETATWGEVSKAEGARVRRDAARQMGLGEDASWSQISERAELLKAARQRGVPPGEIDAEALRREAALARGLEAGATWGEIARFEDDRIRERRARQVGLGADGTWAQIAERSEIRRLLAERGQGGGGGMRGSAAVHGAHVR